MNPDQWKTPRRYSRRNEWNGIIQGSCGPQNAGSIKCQWNLLCHLNAQEINHTRDDVERALKEEMQQEIQKQKTELHASGKMELRTQG